MATARGGDGRLRAGLFFYRPQSSSASRVTAGAFGFFILSQSGERPERYGEPLRFDTMPSRPELAVVTEDRFAVVMLDVFIELQTGPGLDQD